jgi:CBS domain-containing protein
MTSENETPDNRDREIFDKIRSACSTSSFGVLQSSFLCQSLSILAPSDPVCIQAEFPLSAAIELLQKNKIGCVVISNDGGKLQGIFTERDCLLKVMLRIPSLDGVTVGEVMTPDPVTAQMDTTMAFALTLMSSGGFRHLPIVDESHRPIGVVSVKDMVDFIVAKVTEDLAQL